MASKSSGDDPMDLGPFLQNFVMKNPFKMTATAAGQGTGSRGLSTPRLRGPWPRLSDSLKARRRVKSPSSTMNGSCGGDEQVSSSPSNDVKCRPVCHDDVTAWYVGTLAY